MGEETFRLGYLFERLQHMFGVEHLYSRQSVAIKENDTRLHRQFHRDA